MKVFLSYARVTATPKKIDAFRDRLQTELELIKPGSSVFIDKSMYTGEPLSELHRQLDESAALLLLLTSAWLKSRWCRDEFNHFTRQGRDESQLRRVIPLLWVPTTELIEGSEDVIARVLSGINWSDWTKLRHRGFGESAMGLHFENIATSLVRAAEQPELLRFAPIPELSDSNHLTQGALTSTPEVRIYSEGSDYEKDTRSLMIDALAPSEIHIDRFVFNDSTTISDLESACVRVLYPQRKSEDVVREVTKARRVAYNKKYIDRKDDEKLALENKHGSWTKYLELLLASKGVDNYGHARVIDVGLGTGKAYLVDSHFSSLRNLTAVDLSETALHVAAHQLPNARAIVADGENLVGVETGSQDIYFSFRTYNSTLFHRRRAVWEAYRVLSVGGISVVSIPRIYYDHKTESVTPGLGDARKEVSEVYLWRVVHSVRLHFEALGFRDVSIDDRSPYEIYIFARRT